MTDLENKTNNISSDGSILGNDTPLEQVNVDTIVCNDILPSVSGVSNIGIPTNKFNQIHCKTLTTDSNSIYIGDLKLSTLNNNLIVNDNFNITQTVNDNTNS